MGRRSASATVDSSGPALVIHPPRQASLGVQIKECETFLEVECRLKYQGYIERQLREIDRVRTLEDLHVPGDLDYATLGSLSSEVREKLAHVRPVTLGQAARIPGVTPAAISILAVHLRRHRERPGSLARARGR